MMPLTLPLDVLDNMMPQYDSEKCYPLFEQGPCKDGDWFVLNSLAFGINGRLLPYPHCEKATYCDGELETDYEGLDCLSLTLQFESTNYIGGSGLDICDEGQVKDTRGECITAYTFSAPEEDEDVKKRGIKKPTPRRNLREYLRSKYRF